MAGDKNAVNGRTEKKKFSRRDFVVGSGTAIAGGALAAVSAAAVMPAAEAKTETKAYPLSTAYLVYDSQHCAGCYGCVIACSLVHEGSTSFSLSRIQVHRAVLEKYPLDIQIHVCRQCPEPLCVENCPTGACHVSAEHGNIRMIDSKKCIGCETCIKSCPHLPHRTVWNPETKKSTKCDLCVDTPYYNKKGGPGASQACVEACPVKALKVVAELPSQTDISGYDYAFAPQPQPKAKPGGPPAGAKPATETPAQTAPKS